MTAVPATALRLGDQFRDVAPGSCMATVLTVRSLAVPTLDGGHTVLVEPNDRGKTMVKVVAGDIVERIDGDTVTP